MELYGKVIIALLRLLPALSSKAAGGAPKPGGLRALAMAWSYRMAEGTQHYRNQIYRAMYLLGFTPWDRESANPRLAKAVTGDSALHPGRALELGCGTGTNSIYLAGLGWDVTAVDLVPEAIAKARAKAAAAGRSPRFVRTDVTCLPGAGLDGPYDLLLDVGCFHAVPIARREAYVRSVSQVAAPGATMLLIGQFARTATQPGKAGVTVDEVRQRFEGWDLVQAEQMLTASLPDGQRDRAAEWFDIWHYELRRHGEPT
jgi:cyclopropane fatty-acyl-phospholipid synthase-like methyltransferase